MKEFYIVSNGRFNWGYFKHKEVAEALAKEKTGMVKTERVRVITIEFDDNQLLKNYIVVYYNRFANETQTFKIVAKNEFRAGRLFYIMHNRKAYHACIESITEADDHFWTEEKIREKIKKQKK